MKSQAGKTMGTEGFAEHRFYFKGDDYTLRVHPHLGDKDNINIDLESRDTEIEISVPPKCLRELVTKAAKFLPEEK